MHIYDFNRETDIEKFNRENQACQYNATMQIKRAKPIQ